MTKQWMEFWISDKNLDDRNKLNSVFEYLPEYVGRSILYQINSRKTDIIAEFGCGNGALLSFIEGNSESGRTVGIDFCSEHVNNNLSKNSMLLLNDVFNVELKTESVDRSFCNTLFNYLNIDECVATFEEMYRITKKGGFILCANIIKKEFTDVFNLKLKDIKTPSINMDLNSKILENIANSTVSDQSKCIVYDNELLGYENNGTTMNMLVWKL